VDPERARELLARERARIERELADLATPGDGAEERVDVADPGAAGSELFEREQSAGLVEQLREELAAIARAEERIAQGTYGRSIESGAPIPDARLEVVPWAERTVEEQAAYERGR
jgi:RNA polymerase-binding transcription factor